MRGVGGGVDMVRREISRVGVVRDEITGVDTCLLAAITKNEHVLELIDMKCFTLPCTRWSN